MNQCLRCKKPCEAGSVFCHECRLLLKNQLWQRSNFHSAENRNEPFVTTSSGQRSDDRDDLWKNENDDPLDRITSPLPQAQPATPPPLTFLPSEIGVSVGEQAINKLNEAAQRIAQEEQGHRHLPRASRLSPLRDISQDIRRESTPLPQIAKISESEKGEKREQGEQQEDLRQRMPDIWPWLQSTDQDENENDVWSNQTDPLIKRQFPRSAEIARLEEEDIRRAAVLDVMTAPLPALSAHPPLRQSHRLQRIFAALVIFALLALIADGVLVSFLFTHSHQAASPISGPPSLTLSSNTANVGQTILLHIRHFPKSTHVSLSHDIQEPLQLVSGPPYVDVGATGSTDVAMLVDMSWGAGFHSIEAEDVVTRYTASAILQITGAGPTRPSRLVIGVNTLDMGADAQGANTIQPFTLHNSGGGSISWAGSSNQPWLLLSPSQGTFSNKQTIEIAVQRANLKPGDYKGIITFSSNVGLLEKIEVDMAVRPLPAGVGAVLQMTPALLSFTAVDGGSSPNAQMLTISNPGSQPLHWSLASNKAVSTNLGFMLGSLDMSTGWLNLDQPSGTVAPHSTGYVNVLVNSSSLLPGVYSNMFVFNGQGAYNNPQNVGVSLTVVPRCGLTLNTGGLSFTAVSGQSNPGNRPVSITTTSSCAGTAVNWSAISEASWLTATPSSGQLRGTTGTVTSIGVNTAALKPGTYTGIVALVTGQNTQSLMVQLTVQPPPPPSAPVIGAAPSTVNFSTTEGMGNPSAQVVTITNTGGSPLKWRAIITLLASQWLGAGPTGGTIAPHSTGQVKIVANISGLTPGMYQGQVALDGYQTDGVTPAWGSPQNINVTLTVLPPCTLEQPSSGSLSFTATQGSADPGPQADTLTASGNCGGLLNWHAAPASSAPWLHLSQSSSTLADNGTPATLTVSPSIAGLAPGTYQATISVTATGSNVTVQGSPRSIAVTLTVNQPCTLQLSSTNLSFTAAQGQAASSQGFNLGELGSCALPVSWAVTGDAGSQSWLSFSPVSGLDNGSGDNVTVSITSTSMAPGVYNGTLTVSATGYGGAPVQANSQTVSVKLTISGFTLGGKVNACSDINCTSSTPLAGAKLVLTSTSGVTLMIATSDASGNYSFSGLAAGTYTIVVTGTNGAINYAISPSITVTGDQTNFNINALPLL